MGLAIGPALGGILVQLLNWHWVFFINIPIVIICITICLLTLDKTVQQEQTHIDWLGFVLLSVAIASLVTAIVQSAAWGLASPAILTLFSLAFITGFVFVLVENKVKNPIIDLKLFANKPFFAAALSSFSNNFFSYTIFFLMPLYLHQILNLSAGNIGFILLSISGSIVATSHLAGISSERIGARNAICFGLSLLLITALLQLYFNNTTPVIFIVMIGILYGSSKIKNIG